MAPLTLHWKSIERRGKKALDMNLVPAADDISYKRSFSGPSLLYKKILPFLYFREFLEHKCIFKRQPVFATKSKEYSQCSKCTSSVS